MTRRRRARARRCRWRDARPVPQPSAEATSSSADVTSETTIATEIRCRGTLSFYPLRRTLRAPLNDAPEGTTAKETMFGNLFGGSGKGGASGGSVKASGGASRDSRGSATASEMRCLLRPRERGNNRRERDLALPDRD